MRYDISKPTTPAMPTLGKGTECIKLLLSQASKDMHEPLVPMFFPILGAHISGAEFQYPDLSWKEPTGMMANLVANSGDNKGQLTTLANYTAEPTLLCIFCEISLHYKTDKIPRKPTSDQAPALPGLKQGFARNKLLFCSDQTKKPVQKAEYTAEPTRRVFLNVSRVALFLW